MEGKNGKLDSVERDSSFIHHEFGFHSLCNSIRGISRDIPLCLEAPFNLLNRRRSPSPHERDLSSVLGNVTSGSTRYSHPEASN